jgi:carbamoyl-phosphate synthase small subunit
MASKKETKKQIGYLVLEDGSVWPGKPFGWSGTIEGECVFNTAHTGYQEVLSDPSYRKQLVVFTASQIGNQGFHEDDFESSRLWANGCIVRDYSDTPYHFRKQKSLDETLREFSVPGLSQVDTRRLVLHLREKGNLWGVLTTSGESLEKIKARFKAKSTMEGLSLSEEVSTTSVYEWSQASNDLIIDRALVKSDGLKHCVVMDFGVKRQILRYLIDAGFSKVTVVPSKTSAEEIEKLKPDAIFLSNGPGDPAAEKSVIVEVKKLIGKYPMLGICLGHQILGLALGLKTFKLKFGHHGANHPVMNRVTGKVEITSQNHGFAVSLEGFNADLEMTHINLNDQTVEGFKHRKLPIVAIQFHPESGPGPIDSRDIFYDFQRGFAA